MNFWYIFMKDLRLSCTNFYFYMALILTFIMVAFLLFAIPEKYDSAVTIYYTVDETLELIRWAEENIDNFDVEDIVISESIQEYQGVNEMENLSSREDILEKISEDSSAIGMVISSRNSQPYIEFILQGYESKKMKRLLETSMKSLLAERLAEYDNYTELVTVDSRSEVLNDRINLVPVVLTLNSGFIGLFVVTAFIFKDKEVGSIQAIKVTPVPIWQYLLSKLLTMLFIGLITGGVVVLSVVGFEIHIFSFIPLLIVINIFGTSLGLFITSFYDSMTKAMGWIYSVIIVFAFSIIGYFFPNLETYGMGLLPTYSFLIAFRETFYQSANIAYIWTIIIVFILISIILFLVANNRFKRTLTL